MPPPKEGMGVLKNIFAHYMVLRVYTVMVLDLGCINGTHDGYANSYVKSNSQTSLLRAIGSPTDSRTVLLRAVGKPTIFGTPLGVW